MKKFKVGELSDDPGTTILIAGQTPPQLLYVLSGWDSPIGRWTMEKTTSH